jgi:hypothetical protein
MTDTTRKIIAARLELAPADSERLTRLAQRHERTAAAEARFAVRAWLDQHELSEVV